MHQGIVHDNPPPPGEGQDMTGHAPRVVLLLPDYENLEALVNDNNPAKKNLGKNKKDVGEDDVNKILGTKLQGVYANFIPSKITGKKNWEKHDLVEFNDEAEFFEGNRWVSMSKFIDKVEKLDLLKFPKCKSFLKSYLTKQIDQDLLDIARARGILKELK